MVKTSVVNSSIWFKVFLLFVPLAVGIISSLFTVNMMNIYQELTKPNLSFPSYVFPIAWSILYSLMGVSCVLVYKENINSYYRTYGLTLYIIQLALNFFWSMIFFNIRNYSLALIWIIGMWLVVLGMLINYRKVNTLAFYMNIPYILWLSYAIYLNYFILLNN